MRWLPLKWFSQQLGAGAGSDRGRCALLQPRAIAQQDHAQTAGSGRNALVQAMDVFLTQCPKHLDRTTIDRSSVRMQGLGGLDERDHIYASTAIFVHVPFRSWKTVGAWPECSLSSIDLLNTADSRVQTL